jgi:hypothetical protein
VAETAPDRIWLHQLIELLAWYEANLCAVGVRDPLDNFVKFTPERLPHLIKLKRKDSNKEVKHPLKQVNAIRSGAKTNADFGGYDAERAQTIPWIIPAIKNPTKIFELISQPLTGPEKSGDTIFLKEFTNTQRGYRFKAVVCRRGWEKANGFSYVPSKDSRTIFCRILQTSMAVNGEGRIFSDLLALHFTQGLRGKPVANRQKHSGVTRIMMHL